MGPRKQPFITACRTFRFTPHVAKPRDVSANDGRTNRNFGHALSQRVRKLMKGIFGPLKKVGAVRKLRYRGMRRVRWMFTFAKAV